jgi:hypothetical protein
VPGTIEALPEGCDNMPSKKLMIDISGHRIGRGARPLTDAGPMPEALRQLLRSGQSGAVAPGAGKPDVKLDAGASRRASGQPVGKEN